jgi:predicted RNA binding protein YcfA (HicA-like mRNA interferase family)
LESDTNLVTIGHAGHELAEGIIDAILENQVLSAF